MKVNCIIIDDDQEAIQMLESYIQEIPYLRLTRILQNPVEALKLMNDQKIDVAFIEINMAKINGLEFIKNIRTDTKFVITTAYREFAAESYELDVLDYLLKPVSFSRFLKTAQKLRPAIPAENQTDGITGTEKTFVFLKVDKKHVKIRYDEIFYIESVKDYIQLYTTAGEYLVHKSMNSIEDELPSDRFLRIHRSFLIAINEVDFIEGNTVQVNKKRIPIGRKYTDLAKNILLSDSD
jgi:DNA-binding LytR/AlgR family response regulator